MTRATNTSLRTLSRWGMIILPIILVLGLLYAYKYYQNLSQLDTVANERIFEAYKLQQKGVMVTGSGKVSEILPDDKKGDRHQRFIVLLDGHHSVLIVHNIDLAPRIPLKRGDAITFKGEYKWNALGGIIHWTHDTTTGDHPMGWIEHQGVKYH